MHFAETKKLKELSNSLRAFKYPGLSHSSVVLVWLHIIRFSFSKKASEEENLVLALVS